MTSLPSTSDHQQQLSSLHARISELQAERDGFARIATQTLAIVRAQPLAVRPQGVWIQEGDQDQMTALEGSRVQLSAGKAWRWAEDTSPVTMLPLYNPHLLLGQPRPEITPFHGSFPLEILGAVVDLCDAKTMAIFAQSSLACLNIFGPKLLRSVAIRAHQHPRGLRSLFVHRDPIVFRRLAHGLSLHHIQVLHLTASHLHPLTLPYPHLRFTSPQTVLHLEHLIIQMDFNPVEYPSPPLDYESELRSDDDDDIPPHFIAFRPQSFFLSLFNPRTLTLGRGSDDPGVSDERTYRIARDSSLIISNWSRLRTVELQDIDLFVLEKYDEDVDAVSDSEEYEIDEDSEWRAMRSFFLGLGGKTELASTASEEWNLRWIIKSNTVNPFGSGWHSLPHQLVTRDRTLQSKRVKSATIVVANSRARETVEAEIASMDEEKRGPLRVVCRKTTSQEASIELRSDIGNTL